MENTKFMESTEEYEGMGNHKFELTRRQAIMITVFWIAGILIIMILYDIFMGGGTISSDVLAMPAFMTIIVMIVIFSRVPPNELLEIPKKKT